ncbi:neuronal acetylcholine receptor subunit alpha-10-like [Ptychodera flava]|uniref:neuronal acetylcholine receptor subunit alpha-10-like n=1 Tax=Ptychodera flava TaxID=63121 RepID=UPI00396A5F3A
MAGFAGIVTLIQFVIVLLPSGVVGTLDNIRLRRYLFENRTYDVTVRPVYNTSTKTVLELQYFLSQVLDVDERLQTLRMNVWLTLRWYDEFLTWNPKDFGGITNFKVPKSKLWMPDIWLYENADIKYEDWTSNTQCVVNHNGQIMWAAPSIIKSHCKMDVKNFPFDRQTCNITFGPWLHNASEITVNGTGANDYFEGDTEWDLTGFSCRDDVIEVQYYPDYPFEKFSKVIYSVYLKRLPMYYVFYLVMPCSLISATTLLSFFLPVESGEKVGLGITVLLSLTVFLLLLAETLPPMQNSVPILGQYYAGVMVLVSLSISMSVAVLNLHFRGPESNPVPHWVRKLLLGRVARFVLIRQVTSTQVARTKRKPSFVRPTRKLELLPMMDLHEELDRPNGVQGKRLAHHCPKKKTGSTKQGGTNANKVFDEHLFILRDLLGEFRSVRQLFDGRTKEGKTSCEWKQVAMVMDRVFLIIYVAGTLITMLIIFIQIDLDSKFTPTPCTQ